MKFSLIRYSRNRWIGLSLPSHDPTLVEEFKDCVPVRAWDPETKTWWFPERDLEVVKKFIYEHLAIRVGNPLDSTKPRSGHNPYFILGVNPKASQQEIRLAYEKLPEDLDPVKHGGSTEPFEEVQAAYEAIKWERSI